MSMKQKDFKHFSKKILKKHKELNKKHKAFTNPKIAYAEGKLTKEQEKFVKYIFEQGENHVFSEEESKKWLSIFNPSNVFMEVGTTQFQGKSGVDEVDVTISSSANDDDALLHSILHMTRESNPVTQKESLNPSENDKACATCGRIKKG